MKKFNKNQEVYLLIKTKNDRGEEDVFAYSDGIIKEEKIDEILGIYYIVSIHEKKNVRIKKILESHLIDTKSFKAGIDKIKTDKYFK